jgi:hypothetical protein
VLAVARALEYSAEDAIALVAGCVGAGLAVKFMAYVADASVDPEAMLANPSAWVPPVGRVDKTIAALSMALAAVTRDLTDARWRAAWGLCSVATNANQVDAGLFFASALSALQASNAKGARVALTPAAQLMPPRIFKLMTANITKGGK